MANGAAASLFTILLVSMAAGAVRATLPGVGNRDHHQSSEDGSWNRRFEARQEKVTRLHFYFHDTLSGKSPSAVPVARPNGTGGYITAFGLVMMADDPLTEGPEPTSRVLGRAQGLYGSAGQEELSLIMALSYAFTGGDYDGSSLSIMGRNPAMQPVRELPIVGGTGVFRMARGFAMAKTYSLDIATGDAVVEYNVTAIHY